MSTQGSTSAFERSDRTIGRRQDNGAGLPPTGHKRSVSTEVYDPGAHPTAYGPPTSASPAARPYSSVNSPLLHDGYPSATSPGVAAPVFRDPQLNASALHDLRDRQHNSSPPAPLLLPAASPSNPYTPQQNVYPPHPRRPVLEDPSHPPLKRNDSSVPSVPSLAHTDTSASPVSGAGSRQNSYTSSSLTPLPPIDAQKSHRTLPQPITSSMLQNPLNTPSPGIPTRAALPPTSTATPSDSRGGWSALLMATDLMRDADRQPQPEDRPP